MSITLSEVRRDRFIRFWTRRGPGYPCLGFQIADGGLTPPACRWPADRSAPLPKHLVSWYERKYRDSREVEQDAVWTASPPALPGPGGRGWMESMIDPVSLAPDRAGPWFGAYLRFLGRLTDLADGRFPVGSAPLPGITDLLLHALEKDRIAQLLRSDPERLRGLCGEAARTLRTLAGEQAAVTDGGTGGQFLGALHLWAPGTAYRYGEHQSQLFTSEEYAAIILPAVRELLGSFSCPVFYLHPSSFHILDLVLAIEEIPAFEIFVGPAIPAFADILPVTRRIQDHGKALIIRGMMVKDDIEPVVRELWREGVYLLLTKETLSEAKFWSAYLRSGAVSNDIDAAGEARA